MPYINPLAFKIRDKVIIKQLRQEPFNATIIGICKTLTGKVLYVIEDLNGNPTIVHANSIKEVI